MVVVNPLILLKLLLFKLLILNRYDLSLPPSFATASFVGTVDEAIDVDELVLSLLMVTKLKLVVTLLVSEAKLM